MQLISLIKDWHWLLSLPLGTFLVLGFLTPYGRIYKNEGDRKRWVGDLIQDSWKNHYRRWMERILDALDTRLSADELARDLPPARVAFSSGLIGLTMLLAVAYPVLSVTIQWLFGSAISFGDQLIIEVGSAKTRIFVIFWLGTSALPYLLSARTEHRRSWPMFVTGAVLLSGGLLGVSLLDVSSVVLFAGVAVFAGAVAVAVASAAAVVFAVTVAGAVAFAVAGAFAVAAAVAFPGASAFAVALAGAAAVAFPGAAAIAFAGAGASEASQRRTGRHPGYSLALLIYLGAVLTLAVIFGAFDPDRPRPETVYLILFLGALPILNAVADFASIGLTRFLLRRGLRGHGPLQAIWDILGGAVIFVLLGFATLAWLHYVIPSDGRPLINIGELFKGLDGDSGSDYWWLAFMLGSTLIPTDVVARTQVVLVIGCSTSDLDT